MSQTHLPDTIRDFVKSQTTIPVRDLWKGDRDRKEERSSYGSYWYRAIACMMLSRRVNPKRYSDGAPNMTDVNRIGKEANFNQYLFERVAKFLAAAEIVRCRGDDPYTEGPNIDAFWEHETDRLAQISRKALVQIVDHNAGSRPQRATPIERAHLIEFLTLFFSCFRHRAFLEARLGLAFQEFSQLPKAELAELAVGLGLKPGAADPEGWSHWVQVKGGKVLLEALGTVEWAYYAELEKVGWIYAGPLGLGMLGLEKAPRAPDLADTFKVGADLSVFAGMGLAREKLVHLFRHGVIKRIDEVCEFRLDRKRMTQAPAGTSPSEELRRALRELEPLPATVAKLLGTESKIGGVIGIRWCSALVKPEDADVLAAIRGHPNLKGYLEPGAPDGYLLIKPRSDPVNFVQRCRALGFEVESL
jgi:hypothetical protein